MLNRALARAGGALLLTLATSGLLVTTARADGPVSCSPGTVWSELEGTCVISVTAPADPVKTPGQANKPQPAGGKQKCVSKATGKELPCKTSDGYWATSWGCYASLLRPQPPKSDAIWEGHDDGAIYECYDPDIVGTAISWRWAATSPAGPAAPPDPRLLARQAVASMRLKAITIGIVPEPRPDRISVIGLLT